VLEQRRLADARLPSQDQHAAAAGPRGVEQPVQHRELISPTTQHRDLGSGAGAGHGRTLRRRATERNRAAPAYGIDVDVDGGKVTLCGAVDIASQREAAERIAMRVPGVSEVRNRLKVW